MKKKKMREMKAKYYESLKKLNKRIEEDQNASEISVPNIDSKELKNYTKKELIEYAISCNKNVPNIERTKKDDIIALLEDK